jgi:hypothetical protein
VIYATVAIGTIPAIRVCEVSVGGRGMARYRAVVDGDVVSALKLDADDGVGAETGSSEEHERG